MARLKLKRSLCTGCNLCETACGHNHPTLNPRVEVRIQVHRESVEVFGFPDFCRQCKHCPPIEVCPVDAVSRAPDGSSVFIDHGTCLEGCTLCIEACPLDAIYMGLEKPIVCDLCGGDPACVKFCMTEALVFTP